MTNFKSSLRIALGVGCLAFTATTSSAIAVEVHWIGGPAGSWDDPLNWSTGVVPNNEFVNVVVDGTSSQQSSVMLDTDATVASVSIAEGNQLQLGSGFTLTANSVVLEGTVNMDGGSGLEARDFVWVKPTGNLNSEVTDVISGSAFYATLYNQGRLAGAGQMSQMAIHNEGFFTANVPGETWTVELRQHLPVFAGMAIGPHINQGVIGAEGGGTLYLKREDLGHPATILNDHNGVEGLIEAGADSRVLLVGVHVLGGRMATTTGDGSAEGVIELVNTTLEQVHLTGQYEYHTVTFRGTNVNDAIISRVWMQTPGIVIDRHAVLSGNGELNLGRAEIRPYYYSNDPFGPTTFTNDVDHTISGSGSIRTNEPFDFTNRGLIDVYPQEGSSPRPGTPSADFHINWSSGSSLGITNSGLFRARDGASISLAPGGDGFVFVNREEDRIGVLEAGVDSEIVLGEIDVRGGILRSLNAEGTGQQHGVFRNSDGVFPTLRDVRLEGNIGSAQSLWALSGRIGNSGKLTASAIRIEDDVILEGGGEVRMGWGSIRVQGRTLINEDNLIAGRGLIDIPHVPSMGNFINRGIVQADVWNAELVISGDPFTQAFINSGTLAATNRGTLSLYRGLKNYEGSVPGVIHADDNSVVQISTNVRGGILSTSGSGEIVVSQGQQRSLRDVHNQGVLRVLQTMDIAGEMRNDGVISSSPEVNFYGPMTWLTGSGIWRNANSPMNLVVGARNPTILTHDSDHTIYGRGNIRVQHGMFFNYGTIEAGNNGILSIKVESGTTMTQAGKLAVPEQQTMEVAIYQQSFTNHGTIDVEGTFHTKRMNQGPLEFVNAAGGEISLKGEFHLAADDNSGSVTLWNQVGGLIAGEGSIELVNFSSEHTTMLRNSGTIRPQIEEGTYSQLMLTGDFLQDSAGTLELSLGGEPSSGWFDSLLLQEGDASLGGTLQISLADGFEPTVGDVFEILTTSNGNTVGKFESAIAPAIDGGWWTLDYQQDRVLLAVSAITADFNNDGFVDGADLTEWEIAFGVNDDADADGDGISDGHDFLIWQRQYGSGTVPHAYAVPEPHTVWLIGVGCAMLLCRRKCC